MTNNKGDQIGIALSGGGFRATLFHTGALIRLNQMRMLPEIGTFSSVSGGSIIAGLLATKWENLKFANGAALNFNREIVKPAWDFCCKNIDQKTAILSVITGGAELEKIYRDQLVGTTTFNQLPDKPEFVFNAAHLETGRNCTLSKEKLHTWRLGDIKIPEMQIAKAIAASSAFPPAFPPVILKLDPSAFIKSEHADLLHREELKRRISLTDGGVYDNLGVNAIRDFNTILVSDASAPLQANPINWVARPWKNRVWRPMQATLEQTRALRRQEVMRQLSKEGKPGTYWWINTEPEKYIKEGKYPIDELPFEIKAGWTEYIATIKTRLNAFSTAEKAILINWGYIACDLSVRAWFREGKEPPKELPFPDFPFTSDPPRGKS